LELLINDTPLCIAEYIYATDTSSSHPYKGPSLAGRPLSLPRFWRIMVRACIPGINQKAAAAAAAYYSISIEIRRTLRCAHSNRRSIDIFRFFLISWVGGTRRVEQHIARIIIDLEISQRVAY
jgi:hypothetical protein